MNLGVTRRCGGSPEPTSAPTRPCSARRRDELRERTHRERRASARATDLARRSRTTRHLPWVLGSSGASIAPTVRSPTTSRVRETPPRSIELRRRRRARERTSLPNQSGSPRTERSASHSQSSVSKTRGRYVSNPPHTRIAEGDTSVDPQGVPEAKQTHYRKLARYEKSEGGTFGTPEGFQKHLQGTFGTPEGFQKPKPDTFCNPRGCKKYLPRTSRTPDSLEKTEADVSVNSGSRGV